MPATRSSDPRPLRIGRGRGPAARRLRRRPLIAAAGGAGFGAGVLYLFDPGRGRRRRALARDNAVRYAHETGDATGAVGRDLRNRAKGLVAETRRRVRREAPDDAVLAERVRAELGWVCSHPSAVEVEAHDGVVTLSGPILKEDVDAVRAAVSRVPGVGSVEDRLEVHEEPGDVPALQGEGERGAGPRPELLQEHWSPTARLLTGAAGAGLACYGIARRGVAGVLAALSGITLFSRAATNLRLARVTGVGAGRRAIELQKTINIDAPVEKVWEFWDDYENFPRFMSNVREVRKGADGRSHWEVAGPLGRRVTWDAEVTERVPNETLAWKTCSGSAVEHSGIVRFEPADDATRVHLTLSYNPVGGAAGHLVATLLGANPKKQLDEDLLRMKTLIETGSPPRDAAEAG
jgi:uncharacterized membrane protein